MCAFTAEGQSAMGSQRGCPGVLRPGYSAVSFRHNLCNRRLYMILLEKGYMFYKWFHCRIFKRTFDRHTVLSLLSTQREDFTGVIGSANPLTQCMQIPDMVTFYKCDQIQ